MKWIKVRLIFKRKIYDDANSEIFNVANLLGYSAFEPV